MAVEKAVERVVAMAEAMAVEAMAVAATVAVVTAAAAKAEETAVAVMEVVERAPTTPVMTYPRR
jgi:hypothetical protein